MTMRYWKRFALFPVAAFALAACATGQASEQRAEAPAAETEAVEGEALSGAEITTLMTGTEHRGVTRGKPYTVRYADGGEVRFAFDDNSWNDRGAWRVEGDKICVQWSQIRDGREGCWQIVELADGRYLNRSDGSGGGSDSTVVRIDEATYRVE